MYNLRYLIKEKEKEKEEQKWQNSSESYEEIMFSLVLSKVSPPQSDPYPAVEHKVSTATELSFYDPL